MFHEAQRWSRGLAPPTLNLDARWGWWSRLRHGFFPRTVHPPVIHYTDGIIPASMVKHANKLPDRVQVSGT